jgi:adenine phosphoribosyltransferase
VDDQRGTIAMDDKDSMELLKSKIRSVPDFPKAGINFFDITTLLKEKEGFRSTIEALSRPFEKQKIDVVIGVESRGFILGGAVADRLGTGFAPVRKKGKLPSKTVEETYDLEYGTDCLQIHSDAVDRGQRVLIVDDVLATGGTAAATVKLIRTLGGEVLSLAFLIELEFLNGRGKLGNEKIFSVLKY